MTRDDGRKIEAKAIPIMDVAVRLGIEGLAIAGQERVGPCPVCHGKDRFNINPSLGIFLCRICGVAGDGLQLVQHVHGCDFKAALAFLVGDAAAQIDPAELARRIAKAKADEQKRNDFAVKQRARAMRDAREIWHAAQPGAGSPAEAYLAGRNVQFNEWPPTLRFLPDHPYVKLIGRRLQTLHRGACMIAAIQDAAGQVRAVHQTWIDTDAPGQKPVITAPNGDVLLPKWCADRKRAT